MHSLFLLGLAPPVTDGRATPCYLYSFKALTSSSEIEEKIPHMSTVKIRKHLVLTCLSEDRKEERCSLCCFRASLISLLSLLARFLSPSLSLCPAPV